ncbi:hypothetical protein [Nocardioides sp. LHG3406-4]|uniref:hypothetical protein n=1 Tax=Nocardioides sp. LHG3406-4 TaxID=2804575 RepID=UPI003CF31586
MGWRFWAAEKSEAETSLEALQEEDSSSAGGDGIMVSVVETPADRAPGSPLSCLNEGDPVHVGDRVQLATSFGVQETSIVSITCEGAPSVTLRYDERGEIVLDSTTDLSDVYRTSCLMDPNTSDAVPDGGFLLQVHTAEQRDKDVYVVGRASGRVTQGRTAVVSPWTDPRERFAKVKEVEELPDGRIGVLLAKRDASTFEFGDEVQYFAV